MHSERNLTSLSKDLYIYCRKITFSTVGEGWACCTSNIVQTLVFYSQLPGLNRHWLDLVDPLSENYVFHSRNKVGQIFFQHCTNVGNQQSISYIGSTFNRSSQSAEYHDFCLGCVSSSVLQWLQYGC